VVSLALEEEKVRDAVRVRRRMRNTEDVEVDRAVTAQDVQRELELVAKEFASQWYYPGKLTGSNRRIDDDPHALHAQPTVEQKLDAACRVIRSFETAGSPPKINDLKSGLVSALDLVLSAQKDFAKQDQDGKLDMRGARTPEELLSWIARSTGDKYYEQRYLHDSRHAWKLLKSGALRQLLDVDEDALLAFASEVESAMTERLAQGRERPAAHFSIADLLKAVQHNTQTNPAVGGLPDQAKDASPYHSPATTAQICEAEARLGVQLPEDYKAFLFLTNGFGAAWGHSLGDYEPPLHPLSSLRWLDPSIEDYFTDLTLDIPTRWDTWPFAPPPTAKSNYANNLEHFLIGRALEVGTEGIDNTWLIPPSTIQPIKEAARKILEDEKLGEQQKGSVQCAIRDFAGSEEEWESMKWCCVTWASGGTAVMYVFPSFRAYLEDVVVNGRVKNEDEEKARKIFQSGVRLGRSFGKDDQERKEGPMWLERALE
jgi:hypothetical protein